MNPKGGDRFYQTLVYGSVVSAGLARSSAGIYNEVRDGKYIALGYLRYYF